MELTNRMSLWSCILKPTFWFFKELGYFSKHCKRVQIVYGSKHYKCYQYFNIYRMYRLVRLGQSDYALLGTCCPIVFQENQDKIVFLPLGTNSFSTHWKLGGGKPEFHACYLMRKYCPQEVHLHSSSLPYITGVAIELELHPSVPLLHLVSSPIWNWRLFRSRFRISPTSTQRLKWVKLMYLIFKVKYFCSEW